jgi:hypothetical protein
MPRPSQVILLLEDARHQQFLLRYLRKLDYRTRAIRIEKSPSGAGSAEQWVRERFPIEVKACRTRHAQTKLVVLIDADTHTIHERIRQLDRSLQDAGITLRENDAENVVRLTPKRNIETWILCLNQERVDEENDYMRIRADWVPLVRSAIAELYVWTRPNAAIPEACVASLQAGISELRKIER